MLGLYDIKYTLGSVIIQERVELGYQPSWKEMASWVRDYRRGALLNSFAIVPMVKGK